jgi:hypothetical protein
VQLQSVLAAVERQTEKLQLLAEQEKMPAVIAEEVPDRCGRRRVSKETVGTLKGAKEFERQRTQKQNKEAAHQRSLRRQKEAELCRMREEIEKEKASMLAAAEKELSAIKAHIKSQTHALRQKRRRATAEERHEEPALQSLPTAEEHHEEPSLPLEMPAADDSCFDCPDHQDAVSSVESAEVIADSSNEEDVPEAEAQCKVQEEEALEEDWQVLSEGSEEDEALWDLVG